MASNQKERPLSAEAAKWAAEIRKAIAPKPTEIPAGFLRVQELQNAWGLSEVQTRRRLTRALKEGRIEKRLVRAIGRDEQHHVVPVFGLPQKDFDGSRPSK
jgi:Fic family protein